jgi:hypothetical protein
MSVPADRRLFNFPNKPIGYSLTPLRQKQSGVILLAAVAGVTVMWSPSVTTLLRPLLRSGVDGIAVTRLAGIHPRILAVKLDGASKDTMPGGLGSFYHLRGGRRSEHLMRLLKEDGRLHSGVGQQLAQRITMPWC